MTPAAPEAELLTRVERLEKWAHEPFDFTHLIKRIDALEVAQAKGKPDMSAPESEARKIVREWWGDRLDRNHKDLVEAIATALAARDRAAVEECAVTIEAMRAKVLDMGPVKVGTAWCASMLNALAEQVRSRAGKGGG